jgi:hypothetical protein
MSTWLFGGLFVKPAAVFPVHGSIFGVFPDFREVTAQHALMQERVMGLGCSRRRVFSQPAEQLLLRVGPVRYEFRGDVFPITFCEFTRREADAAAFHHTQKDPLLVINGSITGP